MKYEFKNRKHADFAKTHEFVETIKRPYDHVGARACRPHWQQQL